MIPAQQLRKAQAENDAQRKERKAQKEAEFKPRFAAACGKYKTKILDEAAAAMDHVRSKRLNYKYIMLDHTYLVDSTDGYAYTTMLYGFWNKEKNSFDDSIFAENEVEKPFELAVKELDALGYKLENVSDSGRSKRLYIKLSWDSADDQAAPAARADE
jgi:hypothetical protein